MRELLDRGLDYRSAGERLGIPPGQVHLIATGVPADGGDTVPMSDRVRSGAEDVSQQLANPPMENPTTKEFVRRWVEARVRADRQLCEAASGGDLVPGSVQEPDEGDAVTVLTREHNRIAVMLKKLKTLPGHGSGGTAEQISERGRLVGRIDAALSAHEALEDEHLWPVVRAELRDGERWADTAAQQHSQVRRVLTELAGCDSDSAEFDELVGRLLPEVHRHVAHQDRLFLELREHVSPGELDELGRTLRAAGATSRKPQQP